MKRTILILSLFAMLSGPSVLWAQQDTTITAGSSHVVTKEQMNKGLVTNGLGALSGQSAGVTVSGANQSAMLSAVRVRGTTSLTGGNDPLIIIDGVTSDIATLGTLYPGDIDSFTVLKDASETAQYGSRGASGVIRVTTTKGRGEAFRFSYDVTGGFESTYKTLKMLSADDFRAQNNLRGLSFQDNGFSSDMPRSILRTGYVQNHHIAFGGGSGQSHYRASLGILDRNRVVRREGDRNYSAKVDISQQAFEGRIVVDMGLFASQQELNEIQQPQGLFYSSYAFNPTFRAGKEPDGSYSQNPASSQINNPVSLLEKDAKNENFYFNSHVQATANLARGLKLSLFGAYSHNTIECGHFYPTIIWSGGEAFRSTDKIRTLLGSLSLSYTVDFGPHRLSLTGMTEGEGTRTDGYFTTTTGFRTNAYGLAAIQAGADRPWNGTGSDRTDEGLLSFLVGGNYSYMSKYILSATLRADASSKFGKNNRWGYFPSVSASWVASREDFLKDLGWLTNLKFNVGFGLSGNQGGLGPYKSMELFSPSSVVNFNGDHAVAFTLDGNANPDLKWEVKTSTNIGLESAFLDDRIVFTMEYYYSKTKDMLYNYQVSVPPFPYDHLMANLGKMSNSGVELGLGVSAIRREDMQLNINMNLSFQRNKLISLGGYWRDQYLEAPRIEGIASMNGAGFHGGNNDVVFQIVGEPLGVFYLPHCTGLSRRDDGTYYYETDGVSEVRGQASPKALLGSNISFRYRRFDISVQMNGAFGHKIFNGTSLSYMNMGSLPYYNVMKKAPGKNIVDQTVTDYWLEKGDYLNVDYLTLGWNIPVRGMIKNLRLSLSVNNLCTFTGYSGLTPMINSSVVSSTFGLDDKISYPVYRSYTLGISIQL